MKNEKVTPFHNIDDDEEVIDFSVGTDSNDRPESERHSSPPRKPLYKKPAVMMLLVIMMVSGGAFVAHKKGMITIPQFGQDELVAESGATGEKPKTPFELFKEDVATQIGNFGDNMANFSTVIDEFQQKFALLSDSIDGKADTTELKAVDNKVTAEIIDTNKKVSELEKRFSEFQKTQKKQVAAKKKAITVKREKPPFQLVSIDVWNGEANAAVRARDGGIATLANNEEQVGWRVIKIDYKRQRAIFKNVRSGQTHTQYIAE